MKRIVNPQHEFETITGFYGYSKSNQDNDYSGFEPVGQLCSEFINNPYVIIISHNVRLGSIMTFKGERQNLIK